MVKSDDDQLPPHSDQEIEKRSGSEDESGDQQDFLSSVDV
jgi:hypothetical protein